MDKVQLRLDFGQPIAPKSKAKPHTVTCEKCALPIDLSLQSVRKIKACNHCGDRTFLLNLKTDDAVILYSVSHDLGKRAK